MRPLRRAARREKPEPTVAVRISGVPLLDHRRAQQWAPHFRLTSPAQRSASVQNRGLHLHAVGLRFLIVSISVRSGAHSYAIGFHNLDGLAETMRLDKLLVEHLRLVQPHTRGD